MGDHTTVLGNILRIHTVWTTPPPPNHYQVESYNSDRRGGSVAGNNDDARTTRDRAPLNGNGKRPIYDEKSPTRRDGPNSRTGSLVKADGPPSGSTPFELDYMQGEEGSKWDGEEIEKWSVNVHPPCVEEEDLQGACFGDRLNEELLPMMSA